MATRLYKTPKTVWVPPIFDCRTVTTCSPPPPDDPDPNPPSNPPPFDPPPLDPPPGDDGGPSIGPCSARTVTICSGNVCKDVVIHACGP